MEIVTDYENIRFPLKFVSKLELFSGLVWIDLKEERTY